MFIYRIFQSLYRTTLKYLDYCCSDVNLGAMMPQSKTEMIPVYTFTDHWSTN